MLLYACESFLGGIWHNSNFWMVSKMPSQRSDTDINPALIQVYKDYLRDNIPSDYDLVNTWALRNRLDWAECQTRISTWRTSLDMLNIFTRPPDWG